ncbi:MAG: VCBS repeat-containing protein [Opitutaceae bacterium]|nr:VCBS repeat-containing protein [Opitutaceae bacterium]
MRHSYQKVLFDEQSNPKTILNFGMWSYLSPMNGMGPNACDLIVSGLREGVRHYTFEGKGADGSPLYGEGKEIAGFDEWALNVIPVRSPKGELAGFLYESGQYFCYAKEGNPPRLISDPINLGISSHLQLPNFARNVSTGTLFHRSPGAPAELLITVVNFENYYPGEYGVYGGRLVGIDQSGKNLGYDADGKWIGGRGEAHVYLFQLGTDHNFPHLKFCGELQVNGTPLEILDRSGSTAVSDFDNDGNLELVLLNEWQFEAYRLSSKIGDVNLASLGRIQAEEGEMDLRIQFPSPTAITLPDSDSADLIMGSFSGEVYFSSNLSRGPGDIRFSEPTPVYCRDKEMQVGSFSVPAFGDLNGNGLLDMVVGVEDGRVYHIENVGTKKEPKWGKSETLKAGEKNIRIVSGYGGNIQGLDERLHGYACPFLYDWTGNGLLDMIMGSITGYYLLYPNIGTKEKPLYDNPKTFTLNDKPFRGEWRVRPAVADLDGDGVPELILLDTQGMASSYAQSPDDPLELKQGVRLVDTLGRWIRLDNISGAQGRVKFYPCDWTGNGTTDLIVGTPQSAPLPSQANSGIPKGVSTFLLLENVGTNTKPVFINRPLSRPDGTLIDLGGHSCAPAVADINGDGELEIIAGSETGLMVYFPRDEFTPKA